MLTWQQFTSIPTGTRIVNHNFDQCVAVANLYHESVIGGSFVPVGSAYEWWTRFEQFSTLTNNYVKSNTPVAGSIFVAKGGIYDAVHGHIGVVTALNKSGYIDTMEQNAGYRYLWRYTRGMQNMLGFLNPKNNPIGDDSAPDKKTKENELLLQDQNGSIYQADDWGYDSILEFGGGMSVGELIYAAQMLNGDVTGVNNRQRDLINSYARNRWNKKRAQIVADVKAQVGTPVVDTAALTKAVTDAIKSQGVTVDSNAIAKAVEAALQDDLAAIPTATVDQFKNRL